MKNRRIVTLLLIILLLFSLDPAVCEADLWNCPECGRAENSGNYCGSCGCQKPFSIGNIVRFGRYEQDGNSENGPEEIEWIVLDTMDGQCLLISRYGLDVRPFDSEPEAYWENCSLRSWLNSVFFNSAFTPEQQSAILTTSVFNSTVQGNRNWLYESPDEVTTHDKVFLLSYYEACYQYFSDSEERKCYPTEYAVNQGALVLDRNQTDGKICCWWLRSNGRSRSNAAFVLFLNFSTVVLDCNFICVRPALWLNISDKPD